jgi:hypothetical protein
MTGKPEAAMADLAPWGRTASGAIIIRPIHILAGLGPRRSR